MQKKRIAVSLIALYAAEFASKIFPLVTLHLAASRLGELGFGMSQMAMLLLDVAICFVVFGYSHGAPLLWRQLADPMDRARLVMATVIIRLGHAALGSACLLAAAYFYQPWNQYLPILWPAVFVVFTSALEVGWTLSSIQALPVLGFASIALKAVGVVFILWGIDGPEDVLTYVLTLQGMNAGIALVIFAYVLRRTGLAWPEAGLLRRVFTSSLPFAATYLLLILLDRYDGFIVEGIFGVAESAMYFGPQKVALSLFPIIFSINLVFYSETLALTDAGEVTRHLKMNQRLTLLMAMPIVAGVWFVGDDILGLALSPAYAPMGAVLSIFCLTLLPQLLILSFGNQILMLRGRVRTFNLALAIGLGVGVLATALGAMMFGLVGAASGTVIGKGAAALIVTYFSMQLLHTSKRQLLLAWVQAAWPALLMAAALAGLLAAYPGLHWAYRILAGAAMYAVVVALAFRQELQVVIDKFKARRSDRP